MLNPIYLLIAAVRALIIVLSLLIIVPIYALAAKFFFDNTPARAFKIRRMWVQFAQAVLGIRCTVKGQQLDGVALYVANHRSFSDPVIIALYIDAYVIAKAEVANLPLISKGAEMTGVLYVKRDNKESRSAVRKYMSEVLLEGKNILVFPEGTTSNKLNTLPFKKGTFIEAAKHNIPVVPIVLEYKTKKDLWFKSSLMGHHFRQFGKLRTEAVLRIGDPITHKDGLEIAAEAEQWTNDTIRAIHSTWDSDFHKELAKQA